jgi:hypothetical protein
MPLLGQALPEKRLGVHMTAFKARLFDLIQRAGIDGIPSDDLFSLLYPGGGGSRHTLKAHVWQINEMIADEGTVLMAVDRPIASSTCANEQCREYDRSLPLA